MTAPSVVLVAENTSLAASLNDLLEVEGFRVLVVRALEEAAHLLQGVGATAPSAVVVASNGHYSPAVRLWNDGCLSELALVLVGSRDPSLKTKGRLHVISLPLSVPRFLQVIADVAGVPPASAVLS